MPQNFDSSFLTKKRQAQEIYANYIATNQKINQGCTTIGFFQQGAAGTFSSDQITAIDEGAVLIGTQTRDNVLTTPQNNCPITTQTAAAPAPAPGPPSSSGDSILAFSRTLSTTYTGQTVAPTSGGALTINSQSVGNYEYAVAGTTTISSFNNSDWFTSTEDTTSSWIIINGNLTINAGQTFIPSNRKLFTVIYVSGNLTCNGTITMSLRGANHSGTGNSGGATTAVAIRIGTGTFSAVVNPQIPAAGGSGGPRRSGNGSNSGVAGSGGGTGGGGSGTVAFAPTTLGTAGAGAAGTCFVGGGGGGSIYNNGGGTSALGQDAAANGGKGGDGGTNAQNQIAIGGPGNPGGTGYYFDSTDVRTNGISGLAGSLIVICEGTLSGSGFINSDGTTLTSFGVNGSSGGGGSVTVLFKTDSSSITPTANSGGNSGAGTARKLAIGAN